MRPLEVVYENENGPYATLHKFGWTLNGSIYFNQIDKLKCLRTCLDQTCIKSELKTFFSTDFIDNEPNELCSIIVFISLLNK